MAMREKQVLGLGSQGFYRVVYFEWGDPANDRVLVCVHGLTRRGRDFDALAEALADRYRVICVDLPGRGQSDWFANAADYQPLTYLQTMTTVLARLDVGQVDWLGVSLGGLLGMMLAAQPQTPIRKLVLDDIGAYVGADALQRIAAYVSEYPAFDSLDDLEAHMRVVCAPYGLTTDAEWKHLVTFGSRRDENGAWRMHYDPKLAEPFKEGFSEPVALWPFWQMIQAPVLLLRGSESDILSAETAAEMVEKKPGTTLIEFQGVGHAPMLMNRAQIDAVRGWLLG
jgi:Predicted hydrolases or acyltransferases (alpha/beta hydrolase superfamily)